MAYWHFVTCHRPIYPNSEKMIICIFLWPKTLKIDLIWPIFGLILDPSHIMDLSWPIVPFGLSTNSVTPSHAMAYGRNGTVIRKTRTVNDVDFADHSVINDEGCICGSKGELLIWIPLVH